MRQVFLFALLAFTLVGVLIYSQSRPAANQVSGIIEADEIRLGSRVGGRVESVSVDEGDQVTQGMSLIQFEPFDILQRREQAVAELAQREAALEKLKAGLRPEEVAQAKAMLDQATADLSLLKEGPRPEEIEAAQNRLVAAQANRDLAKRELSRSNELYEAKAVSKSDYDRANEEFAAASASVQIQLNELAILQAGSRRQEIEKAEAQARERPSVLGIGKAGQSHRRRCAGRRLTRCSTGRARRNRTSESRVDDHVANQRFR